MRTLVLEREKFPREKVCGDCLNPMAWSVLDTLGLRPKILESQHAALGGVRFVGLDGSSVRVPFPAGKRPKIGISRSVLDQLLLNHAAAEGAQIMEAAPLTGVNRTASGWIIQTASGQFKARQLVAADGRNSTTLRLLGLMPEKRNEERIALQARFLPATPLDEEVVLRFVTEGYLGLAPVGGGLANLCLVGRPKNLPELRRRAVSEYGVPESLQFRSVTPLERPPLPPAGDALWLAGDSAQVLEPFTGEGIAYAMLTGMECAKGIVAGAPGDYRREHARLYRERMWLNKLARQACLHPELGDAIVRAGTLFPGLLAFLTRRVISGSPRTAA